MTGLARLVLEEIAADPVALEQLRELVGKVDTDSCPHSAPAFTVRSLALELGRSQGSIRAAIARGELEAVKRGRGYLIGAEAVAAWTRAPAGSPAPRGPARPPGPARGLSREALRRAMR